MTSIAMFSDIVTYDKGIWKKDPRHPHRRETPFTMLIETPIKLILISSIVIPYDTVSARG